MYNVELEKRIRGVLIGVAVGDAMGMPTEFLTYHKIKNSLGTVTTFLPSLGEDLLKRNMKAGEITDDTINTLLLLDTIIESKGIIDTEKYIEKLINWTKTCDKSAILTGPSTLKALEAIERGIPITETGKLGTTNGAAMKIAPIGIVNDFRNLEKLVNDVHSICLPTHNTGIAIAGASIIAACVSYVISGGKDWNEIWDIAFNAASLGMEKGFDFPTPSLGLRLKQARFIVDNTPKDKVLEKIYNEIGSGFSSIESIPSALAIAYLAKDDPMECAKLCASLGGDTDTIGAMACAICGGINANFPNSTITFIEDTNHINFDDITKKIIMYSPYYENPSDS